MDKCNAESDLYLETKVLLSFEDQGKGRQILEQCVGIINILDDMVGPKKGLFALYRWLTNDTLGSIDQVILLFKS